MSILISILVNININTNISTNINTNSMINTKNMHPKCTKYGSKKGPVLGPEVAVSRTRATISMKNALWLEGEQHFEKKINP